MSFNSFSNTVWRSWFARVSLSSSPVSRHQILVVIHTSALSRIHHLDCQSMYGSHESFCKWLACLRHTFQEVQTHKHLVHVCLPTSRNVKLFERRAKLLRSLRNISSVCGVPCRDKSNQIAVPRDVRRGLQWTDSTNTDRDRCSCHASHGHADSETEHLTSKQIHLGRFRCVEVVNIQQTIPPGVPMNMFHEDFGDCQHSPELRSFS